jgi:hypothetical protein
LEAGIEISPDVCYRCGVSAMPKFIDVAVPFRMFGNRRGLTDEQIANDYCLTEFVRRFRHCFEYEVSRNVWMFIEP